MEVRVIGWIAWRELRDALRNRWFLLYTVGFALLAGGLAYMTSAGGPGLNQGGYGRTAAGLVNLVSLLVPLVGLSLGAQSVASDHERGMLEILLAQPVDRSEVFVGKLLGIVGALSAALAGGFGLSAFVLSATGQGVDVFGFLLMVAGTLVLAAMAVSVGLLISVSAPRTAMASGVAMLVWLGMVVLSDLGLMGSALVFRLQVADLFHLALLNPVQAFKMLVLSGLHASLDVLGPAGLYAAQTYGEALPVLFAASLGLWTLAPLAAAWILFARGRA